MWIKKISKQLYFYVLASFLLSGIVSIVIWYGVNSLLHSIEENRFDLNEEEQLILFEATVKNIKEEIDENNYSAVDFAEKSDFHENQDFLIYIISPQGRMIKDHEGDELLGNSALDNMYISPVTFSDGQGFIIIDPHLPGTVSNIYETIAMLVAITSFVFFSFFMISKQLKYFEKIESVVSLLAKGDLTHKVEIKGQNELARLATSINQMSDSLDSKIKKEKAEDLKHRRLITNLSHDLRTPLTSIIGYLNILVDKKYIDDKEARDYLNKAMTRSEHLKKLLTDLFDYTKLTYGDLVYDPIEVNLNTFVLQYLETCEVDVKTCFKDQIQVHADTNWLIRVMDNLFDNIKKYAIPKTDVNLCLKKEGAKGILILENHTEDDLSETIDLIFERTFVANEARSSESSGLGLTIVKESMKQMNGTTNANYENGIFKIKLTFPIV